MRAEGFDYVEWVDPFLLPTPVDREIERLSAMEFAAEYGFGVTTLQAAVIEPSQNPNQIYYDSLSPAEQKAFDIAMIGTELDEFETFEVSAANEGGPGCAQAAFDAMNTAAVRPEAIDQYYELTNAIEGRVQADPRVMDAARNTEDCMASEGFKLAPGTTPYEHFFVAVEELLGPDVFPTFESMEQLDSDAAQQVRQLERDVAIAAQSCSAGETAAEEAVRAELEAELLEHNYELLQEVAPALRTNKTGE